MRRADIIKFTLGINFAIIALLAPVRAQSTNQDFPTPVTSTEISGTINPRDIGDSRLTSYFYQFDGSQGDLFVNIVTRKFTGDIDVFTQTGLRPLTKIVVYADFGDNETGRVIYLRKPEKMILRVQGRPPGDEAATFRIKFAGSFVASTMPESSGEPVLPTATARNQSGIRVNSVGTIVAVTPKATPTPLPVPVSEGRDDATASQRETSEPVTDAKLEKPEASSDVPEKKVEVVVTDNIGEASAASAKPRAKTPPNTRRRRGTNRPPVTPPVEEKAVTEPSTTGTTTITPPPTRARRGRTPAVAKATQPDPLENINLVILFKDGKTIERPMSQVLRFTVDKGILTVIAKDGSIGRYSIVEVAKVTIE